eukprot:PhM_4_TR19064/c0_g1_i1/m.54619
MLGIADIDRRQGKDLDPQKEFVEMVTDARFEPNHVIATYHYIKDEREHVEHLDVRGLCEFFFRRVERPDGFVQRWVASVGKYTNVIQAVWSPNVCMVTKRSNIHRSNDTRVAMYDRCVTYDGPVHMSDEVAVAAHIKFQVRDLCKSIVEHVSIVEELKVQRLIAYFKVDEGGNLWLLYCGSLRCSTARPLNLNPSIRKPGPPKRVFRGIPEPKIGALSAEIFSTLPTAKPKAKKEKPCPFGGQHPFLCTCASPKPQLVFV